MPNPQAAYCVLRHIIFRTLQFQKIVEFVRVKDIVRGIPTIGIAGAPFKDRVIKDALKYLSQEGILLKIRLPQSKAVTPMYGLNLFTLFFSLDILWKTAILDMSNEYTQEGTAKSLKSLRAQKLLAILVSYLDEFKAVFKYITEKKEPVYDVKIFCDQMVKSLPASYDRAWIENTLILNIKDSRTRH